MRYKLINGKIYDTTTNSYVSNHAVVIIMNNYDRWMNQIINNVEKS